jgi:hypothetical protein
MIPGGIADKLGNRYEAKWLVRNFFHVIADKADWLVFEGVESEYKGFEFAVKRSEITEWHQTKMSSPHGNWTINALKKEGVLKAFSNRLSADKNAHCFFVSQDNAKDFRTLTEKARIANSHDQYTKTLSKEQNIAFDQLKQEWHQSDEVIFDWLNRCFVEVIPERELDSFIESYGDLYFYNGGKSAFPILRDILEKHFNKKLTPVFARSTIKSKTSLQFKDWAFDPTIEQRLNEETDAYLQTYTPFGAGGETIPRDQTDNLLDELLKTDSPQVILLTGDAGSGKSGIVRSAINHLKDRKISHLAFRVDEEPYISCPTKEELGKRLTKREESPVTTLKGKFPNKPSILFIDQADAVSEVSGRDGQVKEVIFRLISDAHNFGGIKIVIACRTFDLNNDSRLKELKKDKLTKEINVPMLDWKKDVEPLLKKKNFDVSLLNKKQHDLLCLPVNLAVFLEIDEPNISFHSLSNLLEKLIEKKGRIISEERNPAWSVIQPLTEISNWMSERQTLNAPALVLDDYQNAADILASEGLIVLSRGKINFFHESFFDYIYARAFVNNSQTLTELLLSTEQHLFRRTQVRQILESLRQNDFERYLKELSSVLFNNNIRFHIKAAVCQWLGYIDKPSEQEFKIISGFDDSDKKFSHLFRNAVFSGHSWFDLLKEKKWIQEQIENKNKDRAELVLWWLQNIAGEHPSEIAIILRSWWEKDKKRTERILHWLSLVTRKKPDDDLIKLCEDVIKSHPVELFQDSAQDRIMMLLHTWVEKSPDRCSNILYLIFKAWFELNPGKNLFKDNEFKVIDKHSLETISKKAPEAFLQGTTDTLIRSINMALEKGKKGENWYDFNFRIYSGSHYGFDKFLGMYRDALKKTAQKSSETALKYLNKMNPHKHPCFMHLYLETIQVNPADLGYLLLTIISYKMVFKAGWHGAEWRSFADAAKAALPFLNEEQKQTIFQTILNYNSELTEAKKAVLPGKFDKEPADQYRDHIINDLNSSGYKQFCILETIGEDLLNSEASLKLHQLRRKFPKSDIQKPSKGIGILSPVPSPIKQPQCDKMSNIHWLSAIKKYNCNEDSRYGHDFIDGGAEQLARELHEATKKDPVRFSKLILEIPYTAHQSYIEHILWGLTEGEAPSNNLLIQAVKYAHKHPDKPFGSAIARLIKNHHDVVLNSGVLEILIWYALNGKAIENIIAYENNKEKETISINKLIRQGHNLYINGINSERGSAWEALGAVLWKVKDTESRIWEAIEIAFEKEALISIRCCIMRAIVTLFNLNKKRFSYAMQRLTILPNDVQQNYVEHLSPLITPTCIDIFPYIFGQLPQLADELVIKLLQSGDNTKELIGAWLIFCESFTNNDYIDHADTLASLSIDHKRLFADVASEVISWTENRHRTEALLKKFFFDKDKEVRKHAANVFGNIKAEEFESYKELASVFLKSPAFADNSFAVLNMLKDADCDVLDLVAEAAQQSIKNIAGERNQHTDFYQIRGLLKQEYTSSESNPDARKKILNLIDLMLINEIYGVDDIIKAHDRF